MKPIAETDAAGEAVRYDSGDDPLEPTANMKSIAIAIVLAASSQLALAQPDKALGKQKFADGKVKYAAGDYRGAAELFEAAYKADPDPAYIFNVGQAYRRSAEAKSVSAPRDCQRSMRAYKKFLAQMPEAANKAEVDGYIQDTTACAGALATEPEIVEPAESPPIEKPPPPIEKPIEKPIERGGTDPKRYAGIGLGVAGAIVLGVGVYYTYAVYKTGKDHDKRVGEVNGPPRLEGDALSEGLADIKAFDEKGASQQTKARVGWAIGGALLAGGAVLYVLGGPKAEQKVVVAPSKDGAMVLGSFRF